MTCLNCIELTDRAYATMMHRKVLQFFSSNYCVDCGESDPIVLGFSNGNVVWSMIADQLPWPKVNRAIHATESLCANCYQRRLAADVGPWGIPINRWNS